MRNIIILALLLPLVPASANAKNGGLLQSGSVSVTALDDDFFGFPLSWGSVSTNLFDMHGNLIKTVSLGFDGSEPAAASTNTFSYDRHGNLISAVQNFDYNLDSVVDKRSMVIYTNFSANTRQQIILIDNNADGTNDEIDTSTYTFDNDNRLIGLVTEFDTDADGITDFRSVESWHYDLDNHRLFYTNISDLYSRGVPKVIATASYVLNQDGDPTSGTSSRYDPREGLAIFGKSSYTYDKFGNLVQQLTGTLLGDPSGRLTWEITTTDFFYSHKGLAARDLPTDQMTKQLNGSINALRPPKPFNPARFCPRSTRTD